MTESENPYFLPAEMLAQLQPTTETPSPDTAPAAREKLAVIALANYRASVGMFPGPFGYGPEESSNFGELRWQEALLKRIQESRFEMAWLATGGDWSFRRPNLIAYNAFAANWIAAGKVS